MNRNNKTAVSIQRIVFTIRANEIIYWLRRIPLIKQWIPADLYQQATGKRVVYYIGRVFSIIKMIIIRIFLATLLWFAANALSQTSWLIQWFPTSGQDTLMFSFFIVVLVWSWLFDNGMKILTDVPFKWTYINQFKGSHYRYYQYLLKESLFIRLLKGIAFAVVSYLIHPNIMMAVFFVIPTLVFLSYEGMNIKICQSNHRSLYNFFAMVIQALLLIVMGVLKFSFNSIVMITVVLYLLGTFNFYRQYRQLDETKVFQINRYLKNDLKLSSTKSQETKDLLLKESRIDDDANGKSGQRIVQSKSGFQMLNAIFYQRHRRIWYKRLRWTVLGVAAVMGIITLVLLGYRILAPNQFQAMSRSSVDELLSIFKLFVIVIGVFNFTEKIVKAFFLNCDSSLLHYGFYRRKEIVWKQYLSRIGTLAGLNLIPVTLMSIFLVLYSIIGLYPLETPLLWFIIDLHLISMMITVYNLTLYYLLQPYTESMEIKSPLYSVLSAVLYFVIYQAPQSVFDYVAANSIVLAIALAVLIVLSVVLVYFFGEKTYKLRKG